MKFILNASSSTDKGKVYKNNEDFVYSYASSPEVGEPTGLLIVADGVGGHKASAVASKIVIDTIIKDLIPHLYNKKTLAHFESLEEKLRQAIQDANLAIYRYAQDNKNDAGNLGSTVTCVLIIGKNAIIANVGDSRTYHFHGGLFEQITKDHSLVGEMVRKGIVTPEEVFTHPHRSVITRALGNEEEVDVDTFQIIIKPGNRLLLCSDGLWEMIHSKAEISEMFYSDRDISVVANRFVEKANEYGGKDNIGVVIAEMLEI